MAAAVFQRHRRAVVLAVEQHRLVEEDAPLERASYLMVPRSDVPGIADEHGVLLVVTILRAMVRGLLKAMAWLLGAVVLLLATWFGINATDQELSAEARAALDVPRLPAPDRDNGWLDYLVLSAPADVPTFDAALERLKAIN